MAITIRFSIHLAFHLKKNAAETIAMICAVFGKNAVSYITCKRWYQKFRPGEKEISVLKMNRVLDALNKLKRTNCKHCWI